MAVLDGISCLWAAIDDLVVGAPSEDLVGRVGVCPEPLGKQESAQMLLKLHLLIHINYYFQV